MSEGTTSDTDTETDTDSRALEEFLAGERLDDVALFLADSYVEDDRLERFGERVEDGVLIIVDGERGRNAFQAATGTGAMEFAGSAMQVDGIVDSDLAGGTCPEAGASGESEGENESESTDESDGADSSDDTDEHDTQFVFAFAEAQNEEVGGIYADGDVIHAYAQCTCGTAYSDRWTLERERSGN